MIESSNGNVATSSFPLSNCENCGELAACLDVFEDDKGCDGSRDLSVQIVKEDLTVTLMQDLALGCRFEPLDASERRCHQDLRIIIDSGASSHMLPCRDLFRDVSCTVQGQVSLGKSDYKLRIAGQGTTAIGSLEAVLWVPGLSFGLISVTRFDAKGYRTVMENGKVVVNSKVGEVVLTGTLKNSLYYLDELYIKKMWGLNQCSCSHHVTVVLEQEEAIEEVYSPGVLGLQAQDDCVALSSTADNASSALDILHRRLGHASEKVLKKAIQNENYTDSGISYDEIKNAKLKFCPSCHEGKMKAFVSPDTVRTHAYDLFEKICVDYKGRFSVKSIRGNTGFYLLCDNASGNVFGYPCAD